ncbi:MAG: hypothetical protein CBD33_00305 [Euryarchaeota archaeon TMED173]|nr:MAG: hypothetical protein CBD33_00305 [Euryarchaeota archaeon TMED173]|tara:strand:- start:463 stop:1035 length:573 start_codon:yes stop_codon:yes gene_type:complete
MEEFQGVLTSRRTIYRFKDDAVDQNELEKAFMAARNAPCHKHTNPWRFYVLGPEARRMMVPEIERLSIEKANNSETDGLGNVVERAVRKILQPPVLICVTSLKSPEDAFREQEDYAATVCATHNMVLSLWAQGIGCQWSTGTITRSNAAYSVIGASRDEEGIIGFIKAGYPKEVPKREKKDLVEIRSYLE